jgi:hypothetical protein
VIDPAPERWVERVVEQGMDPWLAESAGDLYRAIASGAFETVIADVERTLGRPARGLPQFVRDELLPVLVHAVATRPTAGSGER